LGSSRSSILLQAKAIGAGRLVQRLIRLCSQGKGQIHGHLSPHHAPPLRSMIRVDIIM
jgi:hypothetical protein